MVTMRSNVENMPYLRNMNKAKSVSRALIRKAGNSYQRLLDKRNKLISKGREYIYRAKVSENEGLYEKGQAFFSEANQINSKMLRAYQDYKDAERKFSKMNQ